MSFLGPQVTGLFAISIVTGIFWFAAETGFIYIMQGFVTSLGLVERSKTLLPDWYPTEVKWAVLILIFYGTFRSLLYGIKLYVAGRAQQVFIREQRTAISRYIFSALETLKSHEMLALFSDKVNNAGQCLVSVSFLANTVSSALLFLAMGFYIAPKELLVASVLLVIFVLPLYVAMNKLRNAGNGINKEWNYINEGLLKGIKNYLFLKIYGQTGQQTAKVAKHIDAYSRHFDRYLIINSAKKSYPLAAGVFVLAVTTYISIRYFTTPAMQLLSFFYLFIRLAQCASDISGSVSEISVYQFALRDLYYWHRKLAPQIEASITSDLQSKEISTSTSANIKLKNVSFAYEDGPTVVNDLSVEVSSGDLLLVKGPSGAGKSTLLYLLMGLLKPNSGEIYFNDRAVSSAWISHMKKFAYVGPEPFITDGTVRDNLCFGLNEPVTDEQCWRALDAANLRGDIEKLNNKLLEPLREFTQLSTGQKQRLSLARAFLRDPAILVLDEATANLDEKTERMIVDVISRLKNQMLTVVVSHKNSFDSLSSQTIVMEPHE